MTRVLLFALMLAVTVLVGCKSSEDPAPLAESESASTPPGASSQDEGLKAKGVKMTPGPGNSTADQLLGSKLGGK